MKKRGFAYGFLSFLSAFKILFSSPRLLKYAILPFLVNIVLLILIFYLGFSQYGTLMNMLLPEHTVWWQVILYWISWIIFPVIFLIILFYTFLSIAAIVSSPFLEILSKRYIKFSSNLQSTESSPFLKVMWEEAKKIFILLLIAIIAFPVNFIPIIGNFIYYFISVLLFAFEFMDYPMSINEWSFKSRYRFLFKNLFTSLGLGTAITLSFIIPVIGFLCLPVSTIAGTKIFLDSQQMNRE